MSIRNNTLNQSFCGCTRREMIRRLAGGSLLLSGILADLVRAENSNVAVTNPLAPKAPHFSPRAKRVILLYMTGGVSHVDSLDPKPKLFKDHGKTASVDYFEGKPGNYSVFLKSPLWQFKPRGRCGTEVSDLFPHLAECVDDLCVIRSMRSDHSNHYEASLEMHTGSLSFARPSIGSWVSYGLGTMNQNLPSFMVIAPKIPYGGEQDWDSNFLPAHHQGTRVIPGAAPIADLERRAPSAQLQQLELQALQAFNQQHLQGRPGDSQLEARIQSFETAFGMQMAGPEAFDLSKESDATLQLYGLQRGSTKGFAWQCLVARRLAERGVRFIELIDSGSSSAENWDAHEDMLTHAPLARNVDQAIAGMLKDLKMRGMLDDTLVVWTTEFGRTPFTKKDGLKGRDHHPLAFSSWLAGGGVKPGITYGATDEYGIKVAENPVHVHDFHATILHLLGLDHERLTYRYSGRDFRLTDVSGQVVKEIIA